MLEVTDRGGIEQRQGDDLLTRESYESFVLTFEFQLSPGTNSGIKYFLVENTSFGFEYELIDDERNPDAKLGAHAGSRTLGSLYDLIAVRTDKPVRPMGEWNEGRIVVRGSRVEHWQRSDGTLL